MNSLKKKEWKKAIYKEYHNLNNFGTFTIILTSSGIILVNKKNILHKKHNGEGNLICYKAKYVVHARVEDSKLYLFSFHFSF